MTAIGATSASTPVAGATPAAPSSTVGGAGTTPMSTITSDQAAALQEQQSAGQIDASQPDATYPTLLAVHVAVLRAAGTPEMIIQNMAQQNPIADAVDREIQSKILQDPESWDAILTQQGFPTQRGTTRAGLTAAFPEIVLPAPGTGNPGFTYDGTPESGIAVPGITEPTVGPLGQSLPISEQGMWTAGILGVAAVGASLVIYTKFFKKAPAGSGDAVRGARNFLGHTTPLGTGSGAGRGIHLRGPGGPGGARVVGADPRAFGAADGPTAARLFAEEQGFGPVNGHMAEAYLSHVMTGRPVSEALKTSLVHTAMESDNLDALGRYEDSLARHTLAKQGINPFAGAADEAAEELTDPQIGQIVKLFNASRPPA